MPSLMQGTTIAFVGYVVRSDISSLVRANSTFPASVPGCDWLDGIPLYKRVVIQGPCDSIFTEFVINIGGPYACIFFVAT